MGRRVRESSTGPSGLLLVDKPQGVTSHDVVAAARHELKTRRVGHAGTLDPMATGLLIVGFGHATRLLNYIVDHSKSYQATIRLGQATSTDDADGEVIAQSDQELEQVRARLGSLTQGHIKAVIEGSFTGLIQQVPSSFSAIKIKGQRAYDLARQGKEVHLEARPVTIRRFSLDALRAVGDDGLSGPAGTAANPAPRFLDLDVTVECSAGTYIRSLARDLGQKLGVGGHLTRLRRTRIGAFDLAMPQLLTAQAVEHSFTNREGQLVTRPQAVFDVTGPDLAKRALAMAQAAALVMPTASISADQARDLRFGRWIDQSAGPAIEEPTAALLAVPAKGLGPGSQEEVPQSPELVAVVGPVGAGKLGKLKPLLVFPVE
ncbi:tRNA pseudouridine(55) synthase TruB [Bifidobacterium aemilianum]|uniref:tRNA pseudouridine synthase B n=1 Tax=Bifidobacterium aemilianum TaxID=2493120 RepID=A0A366K797_9BIFI|nr:tRNA pseudouridine(55) synthase TruB [Bifidobacterium aemilianum]RBP97534.1 tRNA pseudouridine(55) synthase TruB [Bifidobacterium aemilianum]